MKRRKGFTLVELVIVIAVIVILAAVLIPTFSGVIEKANNAKDYSLVSEMNKVLALEEATEGKNNTMYEATLDLNKYGMDIEKLPSSKGYSYVWNAKENRIALLNGENKLVFPEGEEIKDSNKTNYFAIAREASEVSGLYEAGYSVYLSESNPIVDVEAKQGFDAGNNSNYINLTYNGDGNEKDIIIRTNGGKLTANGKFSTINHFGKLSEANLNDEVAYIENGTISGILRVNEAYVRIKKSSIDYLKSVSVVYIEWVDDFDAGRREIIIEDDSLVIISDDFEEEDEALEEVKNLIHAKNISSELMSEFDTPKFRAGSGTEADPYLVESPEGWSNIPMEKTGPIYFKLGDDITPKWLTTTVAMYTETVIDLNGHNLYIDSVGTVEIGTTLRIIDSVGTGKIIASGDSDNYGIFSRYNNTGIATLILDGCNVESVDYIISDSIKLVINSGNIKALDIAHSSMENTEVIVNGGYYNFDPTSYINSETHEVVKSNDLWEVIEK